ncbi:acyl-CoA dehydrogenase family protein [Terrilactibacillus sp. S3-3]|nr:acyl-CoA dehydrogenase family protein [Terrilactibacillus sp. S3-3]
MTNASYANFFVVLAKNEASEGSRTFTALIVDRDTDGVEVGKKEKKMGIRASNTASVIFNDVRVPVENRIAKRGMALTFL